MSRIHMDVIRFMAIAMRPGLRRLVATSLTLVFLILIIPNAQAAQPSLNCSDRPNLTRQEKNDLQGLTTKMSYYEDLLGKSVPLSWIESAKNWHDSDAYNDRIAELSLEWQFTQLAQQTVGRSKALRKFIYMKNGVHGEFSPEVEGFTAATLALRNEISDRYKKLLGNELTLDAKIHISNEEAASRLALVQRREQTLGFLDLIYKYLLREMTVSDQIRRDQVRMYGQAALVFGASAVFVGTLALSAPIVTAAAGAMALPGMVMAGCGIGSAGGGAAAILQSKYQTVANAIRASENNDTAFSCELRKAMKERSKADGEMIQSGFVDGAIAGCAFVGVAVKLPKITAAAVMGAVGVATAYEATHTVQDAISAHRAWLEYEALTELDLADQDAQMNQIDSSRAHVLNVKKLLEAQQLAKAQTLTKDMWEHALNTFLTGVLVKDAFEFPHALHQGRLILVALVSKSSDNAAVAVKTIAAAVDSQDSSK
jgi:hypothetical protein